MPIRDRDNLKRLAAPFRITNGRRFRLSDIDPDDTQGLRSQARAKAWLQLGVDRLSDLQEKLYASDRWSVLLIFQAMDAAGKDSTIEHVMSGVNPQGCQVYSFKAPSAEELDHDYLWRVSRALPERGRIGIFNRSHYEEVLTLRVHSDLLAAEKLPPSLVTKRIWKERFEDINAFELHLARNGVLILKFFLHVSREEQRQRFLRRLDQPDKHWKFALGDVRERGHWDEYMHAYEDMIRHTAQKHAPWYVVPADHKWFMRIVVSAAIVDAMDGLDLKFPTIDESKRKELAAARKALLDE